jgi:hypothetical protein
LSHAGVAKPGLVVLEIPLTPRDGALAIDVKGNPAAMLAKASPAED